MRLQDSLLDETIAPRSPILWQPNNLVRAWLTGCRLQLDGRDLLLLSSDLQNTPQLVHDACEYSRWDSSYLQSEFQPSIGRIRFGGIENGQSHGLRRPVSTIARDY